MVVVMYLPVMFVRHLSNMLCTSTNTQIKAMFKQTSTEEGLVVMNGEIHENNNTNDCR